MLSVLNLDVCTEFWDKYVIQHNYWRCCKASASHVPINIMDASSSNYKVVHSKTLEYFLVKNNNAFSLF